MASPVLIASVLDFLLSSLAVLGGLVALLIVGAVLFVLYKWRQLKKRLKDVVGSMAQANPFEVHLNQDLAPDWLEEEATKQVLREVEAAGLRRGAAYVIKEMPDVRLCSLWLGDPPLIGAIYHHPMAGTFVDMFARFTSGREVTVTNSPMGDQIERRPEADKTWLSGESVAAVVGRFREKVAAETSAPVVPRDEEDFRGEFEAAYRRDMAWRNARGGVSAVEFHAVGATLGPALSPESEEEAFYRAKRDELDQRHEECLAIARRTGVLAPRDPRWEEGGLFIVAEALHGPTFAEYVAEVLELPELSREQFAALATEAGSNAAVFERLVRTLSPALRPQKVGEVSNPIAAAIWSRPMD